MSAMTLVERGGCPLCGATAHTVFHAFEIPIFQCSRCGFLYSGLRLSDPDLRTYYGSYFGGERHKLGQTVNARVNAAAVQMLVPQERFRRILDIGCGYGFLMRELRDRLQPAEVWGIEPSAEESSYARDALGFNVITDTFSAGSALPTRYFDLIVCCEVIEHTLNPVEFVHALSLHLAPGGHLLIVTDNFRSRVARLRGAEFPKWIPHTHISHFDPGTLTRCIGTVEGLEVPAVYTFTPWELVAGSVLALVRRRRPAKTAYSFAAELVAEKQRAYRLFGVRKFVNPLWFRHTVSRRLEGALMCCVTRYCE
jgi:SAM-dependent methyltransferase